MKRIFELPAVQELSKEQEIVRALPREGRHLVIGGPGTGKSVVALYRARRHEKKKDPYIFLVFNRLLHEASCLLGGSNITCVQWQKWLFNFFKSELDQRVPRLAARKGSDWQDIDWDGVDAILSDMNEAPPPRREFIIIDEGQDMPPAFYKTLVLLGFENFFVVADQNQQIISGENSGRRDIELQLAVEAGQVVELKENHRNNRATARLSQAFYTGDPASPPPDLPPSSSKRGDRPLMFLYRHGQFNAVLSRILKLADREPTTLTGVICPNNRVRDHYFNQLTQIAAGIHLDHPPSIRTYHNKSRHSAAFDRGGIMVINAQACKGLEFDHVFLADINEYPVPPSDPENAKRLFYVMTARSKGNVILLQSAEQPCPVAALLPDSPDILTQHP